MNNFIKEWQVETQGAIYDADLEELKQWIVEGAVLPSDRVKRGNLRWLAVEKVPELLQILDSPEYIAAADSKLEYEEFQTQFAFENPAEENASVQADETFCYKHTDVEVVFTCDVCKHFFCKDCPKSFGGTVKICPICDALCRAVSEPININKSVGAVNKPYSKIDAKGRTSEPQTDAPNSAFTKILETALPTVFSHLRRQ